jgi:5-methylcytosine-specific restriction endonuclease McrA
MEVAIRRLVRQRAGDCCEYCRLPQTAVDTTLHLEHVIARQHGGTDDPSNLALACDRCNLYKGPNLTGIDPETDAVVPLFHPRRDAWPDHFQVRGVEIVGLTSTGRATVRLLNMNATHRMQLRALVPAAGEL